MPEFKPTDVSETPYLYCERECSMDPADISEKMGSAFQQVWGFMEANAIRPNGPALSVYYDYTPDKMRFRAGFAVAHKDMAKADGTVLADVTPAGRVLHFVHRGSYSTLRDDYGLLMQYATDHGLEIAAPGWEFYLNDPNMVPEKDLVTEAYVSLA